MVFSEYSDFLHGKTDCHDITEILMKVALITLTLPKVRDFLVNIL
jgi:hypothetical protein